MILVLLCTSSCSRDRDTVISRNYHRMTAKYNPLFNGKEAMIKARKTIESSSNEDFASILPLYYWPTEQQVSSISSDTERAREKATKTIKEHSLMVGNTQKNKYVVDAYMLMGEAYFYDREFFKSLEIFNFVIAQFPKSEHFFNAVMWAGRCNGEIGNFSQGREIFNKSYGSKKLPKKDKLDLYLSMAQLEINAKDFERAREYIALALKGKPGKKKKVRITFVLAQLYEASDMDYEAAETFKKVIALKPVYKYNFQAAIGRARNYNPALMSGEKIIKELKKMTKDSKNLENLDIIYYTMAEVKLKEDFFPEAMEYLQKSISSSISNNTQKGLSYIKRGDIHFDFREYVPAEANYDSAVSVLPEKHHLYELIQKKKKSLSELVAYLNTISYEDSVQKLAGMTDAQREAAIQDIIRRVKKEDEEKKRKEEEAQEQRNVQMLAGGGNPRAGAGGGRPGGPGGPGGTPAFYFYNQNLMSSGFSEFVNKWGNRKNEDNWRRKDKTVVSDFEVKAEEEEEEEEEGEKGKPKIDPRYTQEYYVKKLPLDPDSMSASHKRIVKAHEGSARIYKDVLDDNKEATKMLEQLMKRYPDCDCEPRVWYSLCLLAQESSNTKRKELYCDNLREKYPSSNFVALLDGKTPEERGAYPIEAENLYKEAYGLYTSSSYKKSLVQTQKGIQEYGNTALYPKLRLLEAMCWGKLGHRDTLKVKLEKIIAEFDKDPVTKEANMILAMLIGGTQQVKPKSDYFNNIEVPHQVIIVLPNTEVNLATLKAKLSDYNVSAHPKMRLQQRTLMMGSDYQLLIVSGFRKLEPAIEYYSDLVQNQEIKLILPFNHHIFAISNDNFKTFYQKQQLNEYLEFFDTELKPKNLNTQR